MSRVYNPSGYLIYTAFSAPLSAAPAGSTHFTLRNGGYAIWADQPFGLVITDAATDPDPVPSVQQQGWPGALVGAGQVLEFLFDDTTSVLLGSPVGTVVFPTGIRVFRLGSAGTFYITQFNSR